MTIKFSHKQYGDPVHPTDRYQWHGGFVEFDRHDQFGVEKLKCCPLSVILYVLNKDNVGLLEEYLTTLKRERKQTLLDILEKKWHWRETGEPVVIEPGLFSVEEDMETFMKKLNSKKSLPVEATEKVIEWFTGLRSEVYVPEE